MHAARRTRSTNGKPCRRSEQLAIGMVVLLSLSVDDEVKSLCFS